jgi:hypothetical protein
VAGRSANRIACNTTLHGAALSAYHLRAPFLFTIIIIIIIIIITTTTTIIIIIFLDDLAGPLTITTRT